MRNKIVSVVGILATAALVVAALGFYRVFSYLAAALIIGVLPIAAIERGSQEFDLAPYTGIVAGLAVLFAIGLTGIWVLWNPDVTNYSYILGIPQSTFIYIFFIWFLPLLAPVYYAMSVFGDTANDELVSEVMDDARQAQRDTDLPLAPSGSSGVESDGGSER
ncbi:hypothetical protein C448_08084 [Halococcus morrhuae DSM 1307]|uniref:Uncharacterized protein n=1 Tax=Halococcus morrhuae DSM 1307 TaxID=931277 RepID=M0MJI1_HALMO|nr:hypothetical protein [Halococcus morrhuae]EMA44595.1 hypothetical protein C448_08084 [Halococcus morrhuae DSM 1307]